MKKYCPCLVLCFAMLSCVKEDRQNQRQNQISGSYSGIAHYVHTWVTGQSSYGTVLDTIYPALFNIEQSSANIARVQFPAYNGVITRDELYLERSDSTTLFFLAPAPAGNRRSELMFNEANGTFRYTSATWNNPSGGGSTTSYTIESR